MNTHWAQLNKTQVAFHWLFVSITVFLVLFSGRAQADEFACNESYSAAGSMDFAPEPTLLRAVFRGIQQWPTADFGRASHGLDALLRGDGSIDLVGFSLNSLKPEQIDQMGRRMSRSHQAFNVPFASQGNARPGDFVLNDREMQESWTRSRNAVVDAAVRLVGVLEPNLRRRYLAGRDETRINQIARAQSFLNDPANASEVALLRSFLNSVVEASNSPQGSEIWQSFRNRMRVSTPLVADFRDRLRPLARARFASARPNENELFNRLWAELHE